MENKSVAFLSLGCKVNSYETDSIEKQFKDAGYIIKSFDETADVYVINTCSVTNMADRKSRQMISKARKKNPSAVIVATGCYVQTCDEEKIKSELKIDIAIGNNKKSNVLEAVKRYVSEGERQFDIININDKCEYEDTPIEDTLENTRAYIKIQDGCNQFCSYCIIPYARGRIRSRGIASVLSEVKKLALKGYKEVVVTGIHLSSYGLDFVEETYEMKDYSPFKYEYLLEVLKKINEIQGIERIRLGSLEPRIITSDFLSGLKQVTKLCPHFHLSLQSGCDEILKRMNRKYDGRKYIESLKLLREFYVNPAITTDVIVGFPMESEEEFAVTENFLKECQFSMMHIFKYSRRKRTVADKMTGQIPEEVKTERSKKLLTLNEKMNKSYCELFVGKEAELLFEEKTTFNGEAYYSGHTDNYIKVMLPTQLVNCQNLENQIIKVTLLEYIGENTMLAKMCN